MRSPLDTLFFIFTSLMYCYKEAINVLLPIASIGKIYHYSVEESSVFCLAGITANNKRRMQEVITNAF